MHEKRIEIRWRDMDAFRHVNNAVYLTYLEEVRDEWLERTVEGISRLSDYVIARVAVDFRRELKQADDVVTASCRLVRVGRSSLALRQELRKQDGTLAAEAESVLVATEAGTGRSRPLSQPEREVFERELARDAASA